MHPGQHGIRAHVCVYVASPVHVNDTCIGTHPPTRLGIGSVGSWHNRAPVVPPPGTTGPR
eukprot:155839-Alexandrium_andersonii.AAC.1